MIEENNFHFIVKVLNFPFTQSEGEFTTFLKFTSKRNINYVLSQC